jgi:hypothetical protein
VAAQALAAHARERAEPLSFRVSHGPASSAPMEWLMWPQAPRGPAAHDHHHVKLGWNGGKLIKVLTSDAGPEGVWIVQRSDGVFTYRIGRRDGSGEQVSTIDVGLYDSAETAENEARARTSWLVPQFH